MKQVKGREAPNCCGDFSNLYAAPLVVFSLLVLHNFNLYILYVYIFFKKNLYFGKKVYTVCLLFRFFYLYKKENT